MALYRDPYARLRELAGTNTLGTAPVEALTPEEMDFARRSAIAARRTEGQKALAQGVEGVKASGLSARGLARIGMGDEAGGLEDLQAAQAMQQAAAEFGPRVQSIDDIDGIGSGLEYVRNMGLQQLPNLALAVGTGGLAGGARVLAGRQIGKAATARLAQGMAGQVAERKALRRATGDALEGPLEVNVSRELQERAARRIARLRPGTDPAKAFASGAQAGAVGAGTVLQSSLAPDVVLDPEGTGTVRERAGKAAVGALATGAIDALPVMALFKKFGLTGAESAVKGHLLQRMAKTAGTQGTQEAATEVAQTFGERAAHKWVNENVELMSPEAYSEYLNAAAGGFVGGSMFGAPAGIRGSGKDSPAGNRFAESYRGWQGKFKRAPRPPLDPDGGTGPGTAEAPTEDTAFDLGGLGEKVSRMADGVRAGAAPIASKIKPSLDKVTGKFKEVLAGIDDDMAVDNSISEILDAAPFNYTPAGSGQAVMNEGGGVGLFKTLLPDPEPGQPHRIEQLRRMVPGLSMPQAAAMAMLPDGIRSGELHTSGVIAEAAKLLSGVDPSTLDDDKISAFQAALPPEKRNTFNIMAHTLWQGAQSEDEVQLAPEGVGAEAPGKELSARQGMDEERPLRDTKAIVGQWRAKEGKNIPRGTPTNALILTKKAKSGVTGRHPLSGESIGRRIVEERAANPEFAALSPDAQIIDVLTDYVSQGYEIEPGSMKALKLGSGWMLTDRLAKQLSNPEALKPANDKLRPERFKLRGQSTENASQRSGKDESALNREYGQGTLGRVMSRETRFDPANTAPDVSKDETERKTPGAEPVVGGTPAQLRVTADKETDTRAARSGKAEVATDTARKSLDDLLMRHGGVSEIKTADERRNLFKTVMTKAAKQPKIVAALKAAGEKYAAARTAETAAREKRSTDKVVTAEKGRVQEAAALDSGKVDTRTKAEEKKLYDSDDFNDIDNLIAKHSVGHPQGDFDRRRDMYADLLKNGKVVRDKDGRAVGTTPLNARERAELKDAAARYGEANFNNARKKEKTLLGQWQRAKEAFGKSRTLKNQRAVAMAFSDLKTARKATEHARKAVAIYAPARDAQRQSGSGADARLAKIADDAARSGTQVVGATDPTPLEREGQRQRAEARRRELAAREADAVDNSVPSSSERNAVFAEYETLRKAAGTRYKQLVSQSKKMLDEATEARAKKRTDVPRAQLEGWVHDELSESSDEYADMGRELARNSEGPLQAFDQFVSANKETLRDHPNMARIFARDLQRRLDVNPHLSTVERMKTAFQLEVLLEGGFPSEWTAAQLAGKERRIVKYKAEFAENNSPKLKAIIQQVQKEIDALKAKDFEAVIGMTEANWFNGGTVAPSLKAAEAWAAQTADRSVASEADPLSASLRAYRGSRSRRGLYALKSRIVNSTATKAEKEALLARVNAQIDALRAEISAVGDVDMSQNTRRTKNAAHFKEARAKLKGVDKVEAALKALRDLATPQQKRVIDHYLKSGALRDVPLVIKAGEGRPGAVDGHHYADTKTELALSSRVELAFGSGDPEGVSMDVIGTLLHEATHAATSYAEQTNAESRKAVEQLLEHARTYARGLGIDPDSMYGLSETQEFLAEAFTNPQLQALLQQIPARNTAKFQSLWHEFKALVAQILGFSSADATALDEVFALGLDMAQEVGAKREQAYAEVFGESVDHSPSEGYTAGPMAMTSIAGGMPTDYVMQLKPNERRFLEAAFKRGSVYRQIHDSLDPDAQARLASADEGPAILINAGIALAMQGKLDMTYDAKTFSGIVQGLWEQLSVVIGIPSKTAYARKVLAQINAGRDPATIDAEQILLGPAALKIHRYMKGTVLPKVQAITRDMDARMRATGVPALTQLATLMSQRTGEFRGDGKQSFNERTIAKRNEFLNKYFKLVNDWDEARQNAALLELQQKKANPSADALAVREFYKEMFEYLKDARVAGTSESLGKIEDYFPVAIDNEQMVTRRDEMIQLLANFPDTIKKREAGVLRKQINALKNATEPDEIAKRKLLVRTINKVNRMTPAELAERFYDGAVWDSPETHVGRATFANGDHKPTFTAANSRMMDFIYKEGTAAQIAQFATFQDRNMNRVTINYVNRGVRRAEWSREDIGGQIKELTAKAIAQGATTAQLTMATDYVDMMMGSYGTDWHPAIKRLAQRFDFNLPSFDKLQKLNTALTTYQNLRLLPLALASSLIDPLGVMVRSGGNVKTGWNAYREAAKAIRDQHGDTALRRMANDMGLVERHAAVEALMHVYGGAGDPTGMASKANAALFRFNGLEFTTRFSRLAALSAGNAFLLHHAQSTTPESKRYLAELGISSGDIQAGTDGYVERNEKVDAALNRFVNEAVIRPTAGQRPGWQNDPHFALAAQYKGYLYSFFNTVSRRVGVELANGNMSVLLPIAMYLPVTMAGEMLRDMAQGDDEDREMFDYAKLGVERSGLLGPTYSVLSDAGKDLRFGHPVLSAIGGPTGQQIGKAYDSALSGSFGNTAVSALPASALYKEWGDE